MLSKQVLWPPAQRLWWTPMATANTSKSFAEKSKRGTSRRRFEFPNVQISRLPPESKQNLGFFTTANNLYHQADIIISEPMGFMLVHERMLESYIAARDRFLKPSGTM